MAKRSRWVNALIFAVLAAAHVAIGQGAPAPPNTPAASTVEMTLSPAVPAPGDDLYLFFDDLPSDGLLRAEVWLAQSDTAGADDGNPLLVERVTHRAFDPRRGFVSVTLPERSGSFVVRVVRDAAPERPIATSAVLRLEAPTFFLDLPGVAEAGSFVEVRWGAPALPGDVLVLEAVDPDAFTPARRERSVGGASAIDVELPTTPGTYRVRLLASDGTSRAEADIVIEGVETSDGAVSTCPEQGSEAALRAAFHEAVDGFVSQARLIYGRDYKGLTYDVTIRSVDARATSGSVEASYSGSATHEPTNEVVDASGSISAWFRYDGCAWSLDGFTY